MRVAINLLTENPEDPSGAHWCWTRVVPEMAKRLDYGEELHLLVSPRSRHLYQGCGPNVFYITYPWSNERRKLRTLSEHIYTPVRLPLSHIDIFATLMAPLVRVPRSLVIHMKTMHAFTTPDSITPLVRAYRRMSYPRSVRVADAVVINSESLRSEVQHYLDVDPRKLKLVYEAVDHDLFKPGDAGAARARVASYGVTKPFALFVSSLWEYKNCDGLLRAWALARGDLAGRQLVIVGRGRDDYVNQLRSLAADLGIAADVVFVGGVQLDDTVPFYRAADVLVYPSFNEIWASHPGGDGLWLPGGDLGYQQHAGGCGRSRRVVRPEVSGIHRPRHHRRRRARPGPAARPGAPAARQFTWGAMQLRPSTCIARLPSAGATSEKKMPASRPPNDRIAPERPGPGAPGSLRVACRVAGQPYPNLDGFSMKGMSTNSDRVH